MAEEPEPESKAPGTMAATAAASADYVAAASKETYKDASAGVDSMMNSLIDKAALVTKHWKLPAAGDDPFYLTVRHYAMTKLYVLSISGLLVLVNSKVVYRHTDLIEDKLEVPFTLGGKTGKLIIEATPETRDKKSKVYTYALFHGSPEREIRPDFLTDGTADPHPGISAGCAVTTAAPVETNGSSVQYYNVEVTVNGERRSVSKRFKEFDSFARLLRSAYADAPDLQAEIPKLPRKSFGRHRGDEFIEARRAGLEEFMRGALEVDRITTNPDMLQFLGILMLAGSAGSGGGESPAAAPGGELDDDLLLGPDSDEEEDEGL